MMGVLEVLDRDGQVRSVFKITQWPVRIGRSPHCDVVLDDAHMAGEHAELSLADETAQLTLLPSINGGWQGGHQLVQGHAVALPGVTQLVLGATQLRWRAADAPLAPEIPLQAHERHTVQRATYWLPALLVLFVLLTALDHWLVVDPDARWVDYAAPVLGPLGIVLAWAALWSLANQLFRHRFPFSKHLSRVLVWCCAYSVIGYALPLVAYAFSWSRLMALDSLMFPVGGVLLLWWHASLVWPRARRGIAVGLTCMLVLGLGLQMAGRSEQQYWFGPSYLSALPPPQVRMVSTKPTSALIDDLRPLQAELSKMAKKDNDAPDAAGDED